MEEVSDLTLMKHMKVRFTNILREDNGAADKLANVGVVESQLVDGLILLLVFHLSFFKMLIAQGLPSHRFTSVLLYLYCYMHILFP